MAATLALLALVAACGCESLSFFARHDAKTPKIGSTRDALAAIRDSRDPAVRHDAFVFLGRAKLDVSDGTISYDEIADVLSLALAAEANAETRITIVRSLGQVASPKGTAAILLAADDKEPAVRKAAAQALGALKSHEAATKLDAMLASDANLDVRLAAGDALGNVPRQEAALALFSRLEDSDVAIRHRCRESLKQLTGTDHAADVAGWQQEIQTANFEEVAGRKRHFGITW